MSQPPQKGLPDLDEFFKKLTPNFGKKNKDPFQSKKHSLGWWAFVVFLLLLVMIVLSSMVTVKPGEALVVMRLGVYHQTDGPGLHFTIPVVDKRHVLNLEQDDAVKYSGQSLTRDDSLVEVSANVAYQITDPKTYLLAHNINAILQSELSQATTVVMLQSQFVDVLNEENWKKLALKIQDNLSDVSSLGIKVTGVEVQKVRVPNALAGAFNSTIANAQNQVTQLIKDAKNFATDLQPLAAEKAARSLSYANAEKFAIMVSATRDQAEFKSLLPAYRQDRAATLAYLPLLLANSWQSVKAIASQGKQSPMKMSSRASTGRSAYLRWQTAQGEGAGKTGAGQDEQK